MYLLKNHPMSCTWSEKKWNGCIPSCTDIRAASVICPVSLCREQGFSFVRLDGTLSQKRRAQVIQEFQSSAPDSPVVMLLSLRAGGVGLNLTAASRVFLMEPVSANEEDAICLNSEARQKVESLFSKCLRAQHTECRTH